MSPLRRSALALLLLPGIFLAACGGEQAPTNTGQTVAMVNGTPVPLRSLEMNLQVLFNRFRQMRPTEQMSAEDLKRAQEAALDQCIQQALLLQEAQRRNIPLPQEDLDRAWQAFTARFPSQEEFQSFLTKVGKSADEYRNEALRQDVLTQKLVESVLAQVPPVSEEEIMEAYESVKNLPTRVRASHILLLASETEPAETLEQKRAKLEEIRARIEKGEEFAKLAQEYSQDPGSASQGGDVGFFTFEQMVAPFAQHAFAMKVGELSPVFQTRYGFHLVTKTGEEPPRVATIEEVRPGLVQQLQSQKKNGALTDFIEGLKKAATIQVLLQPATPPGATNPPPPIDPYAPR